MEPGRFGGRKGGNARAEKLTPERSNVIARKVWEARSERNAERSDFRSGSVVLARSNGTLMGRTRRDVVLQGYSGGGPRTDFFELEELTSEHYGVRVYCDQP